MKLKIKETAWGIDRKTGGYRKKVTARVSLLCKTGDIPEFGKGRRHFTIDEVSENTVSLSIHCADPKYNKTLTIKKGEQAVYRPRSFDGGYFYDFKLV